MKGHELFQACKRKERKAYWQSVLEPLPSYKLAVKVEPVTFPEPKPRRLKPKPPPKPKAEPGTEERRSTHPGLWEITKRHLGRVPIRSSELYDRVLRDYGSIEWRVFWTILAQWRDRELVNYQMIDRAYHYSAKPEPAPAESESV